MICSSRSLSSDVICNDNTRVIIKDGKGSDYIHANYVKGNNLLNTFICTQGPMINTIADFWRMVLCEQVSHIVMLCDTIECGKSKCEQYWPNSQDEKMEVGDLVLTNIKMNTSDSHVTRSTISVQVNNGPHYFVKHHRWKTWPDKTVPKSLLAVFRILQVVRSTPNPIIVHCSAGIGRTGSMVKFSFSYRINFYSQHFLENFFQKLTNFQKVGRAPSLRCLQMPFQVAIEMSLQTLLAGEKLNLLETCRKLRGECCH
ncbi:Protein-tyrosine phosphatase [Necator americanus]|uniref:Protein-tyrosine phosphatase n=1 Tax=Necator americanus TaxID=51031 RepID=W2TGV2_NECAM|nr:Protein-tyrosine phosphatase [Necator americanus]ETN80421.1 Protein-tyrosine phosphatase [Necator americanus]